EFFNTECCTAPAVFDGSFTGAPEPFLPGLGCDVLNCETLNFHGTGIVTYAGHGVPDPDDPDNPFLFFFDQVTWKLAAAPEPSTTALLLLGLTGLAVLGRRRKSRTTIIHAG